ncbi:AbrB/MazE/SpoVT family DNA-binding domain-containing protein [Candidatus Bathyarchaeota archaeon]|jgi:bifunctional DNA-binding transcriptional regulator/antitoxin component of YhaV-PrlF toxin-antitoxin module|nr:AbrB/MazE/SpoVT family DNA-binding domain-containing protein [Candidatus Bathyarchaeota archaeon]
MKLQKQAAYKYKDKTHHKYVIIIPEETITKLGWKEGQELTTKVDGTQLIVDLEKVK